MTLFRDHARRPAKQDKYELTKVRVADRVGCRADIELFQSKLVASPWRNLRTHLNTVADARAE